MENTYLLLMIHNITILPLKGELYNLFLKLLHILQSSTVNINQGAHDLHHHSSVLIILLQSTGTHLIIVHDCVNSCLLVQKCKLILALYTESDL